MTGDTYSSRFSILWTSNRATKPSWGILWLTSVWRDWYPEKLKVRIFVIASRTYSYSSKRPFSKRTGKDTWWSLQDRIYFHLSIPDLRQKEKQDTVTYKNILESWLTDLKRWLGQKIASKTYRLNKNTEGHVERPLSPFLGIVWWYDFQKYINVLTASSLVNGRGHGNATVCRLK